jgi:4-aminobutyrate aminotransferase-like enzyme
VPAHVARIGELFRDGLGQLGRRHNAPVRVTGPGALLHIAFDHAESAALGTLFTVRMLDRGFLAGNGFYPSLAHEERHVQSYLAAADEVFGEIACAIQQDDIHKRLESGVRHSGFARLT